MVGFTGGRVGGHDDGWEGVIGGRGEVGIGHEGDVRGEVVVACSEMELDMIRKTFSSLHSSVVVVY